MKTIVRVILFSLAIAFCRCHLENLKLLITSHSLQLKLRESNSYNVNIDVENLKMIQVVYADCDISGISQEGDVTECLKLVSKEPDKLLEGPKINQSISLSFDIYDSSDIVLMKPLMLDYYDNVLTVLVILQADFSMVGYHINFDQPRFSLFVDYRKYMIYEAQALEFLQSNLNQKVVNFVPLSKEDASKKVFASQWIIISKQTGIFLLSKKGVEVSDMRIRYTKNGPQFNFYRTNQAFEVTALIKNGWLSFTTLDKTEAIRHAECQGITKYKYVSAGIPLKKAENFITVGVQNMIDGEPVTLRDLDLNKELSPESPFNQLLPEFLLSLNSQRNLIHFELHRHLNIYLPISFHVTQSIYGAEFIFAAKDEHGVIQQRKFSIDVPDYKYIQLKSKLSQLENDLSDLDITRGIQLDNQVFGQSDRCAFLEASIMIRNQKIVDLREGKSQVHYDYGWIRNLEASTIPMHLLEVYHEYDAQSKVLTVYLYNAATLALMLVDESGVSISYKNTRQKSSNELSNLSNKKLSNFLSVNNSKSTKLTFVRSANSVDLISNNVIGITVGHSYFVSVNNRLQQIFDGQPAVDVRFSSDSDIEFLIYSLTEMILASQISDYEISLTHKQYQKTITTINAAILANTDFITPTAESYCQNLASVFLRTTQEQSNSNMKLVILNEKMTGLFLTRVLLNKNRTKNFVSVSDISHPKLDQNQLESFFFNPNSDICQPSTEKVVKFTLSLDHITFHDPHSNRNIQYPLENFSKFKNLKMSSVQSQDLEFLLCLEPKKHFTKTPIVCDTKRGVISDPDEKIRAFLFDKDIEKLNIFDHVKVSIHEAEEIIKIDFTYEPGTVELTLADQKIILNANNRSVQKNIDNAEYWNTKLAIEYTEADLSLSLFNLGDASSEVFGDKSDFSQIWKNLIKSFSSPIKFEISANTEKDFIKSLFNDIQRSSTNICIVLLETSPSKVSFVVFNKLIFELVKLSNSQVTRQQKPKKPLIRLSITQKSILDPFAELRKNRNDVTSSTIGGSQKEITEVNLFSISNEFQPDADLVCIDENNCFPIKIFPTSSAEVSYVLMFQDNIEALKSLQFPVEMMKSSKLTEFIGHTIQISDFSNQRQVVV